MRGLGNPVALHLTAGHRGDVPQAAALIEGLPAAVVLADSAYDAAHLRQLIADRAPPPSSPTRPSAPADNPFDRHLYRERHLVECCFSRLKQFRRLATRFETTARNYLAVVTLAATILRLR